MTTILVAVALIVLVAGLIALWDYIHRGFAPPRAAEAVAVVWAALDGPAKMPRVSWLRDGKRCATGARGYLNAYGRCVMGESWPGYCRVSWWKGASFAHTALAHELAHQLRWMRGEGTMFEGEESAHRDPKFIEAVNKGEAALAAWEAA